MLPQLAMGKHFSYLIAYLRLLQPASLRARLALALNTFN